MKTVVISQPMYFPWVGMFEQLRIADEFVEYSDVAFSKGSFINRVQVKTQSGSSWLTLPVHKRSSGQHISDLCVDETRNWRRRHRETLSQAYSKAPFVDEMLEVVDEVYENPTTNLAELTFQSMTAVLRYFGFEKPTRLHRSYELGIGGSGSRRVLDIVRSLGGERYVTGHGAKNYLDHELFEEKGVAVEYLEYRKTEYSQLFPPFTPYVTILDLIANMGREGERLIVSDTVGWKTAIGSSEEK